MLLNIHMLALLRTSCPEKTGPQRASHEQCLQYLLLPHDLTCCLFSENAVYIPVHLWLQRLFRGKRNGSVCCMARSGVGEDRLWELMLGFCVESGWVTWKVRETW